MAKFQLAKGVKDFSPEEKILKNKVVNIISKTFEKYGFAPLETPIIERYETLAAKFGAGAGSDVLKETFQFTDQGKRKLALRFELTTSLARYIAMNPTIKMPFKRYEMGPNFRDGPIKLGRTRQFWQCDADTIGTKSMLAEAEQIAILDGVFRELNFNFEIKINNRKVLNGILNQAGIKKRKEAVIAIDKLDKIGKKGVAKELEERGYSTKQTKEVLEIISKATTIKELKKKITNSEGKEGLKELEELFSYLKEMGVKSNKFDVSLARGQAYYTGTVLEAFLKESKITSSIAGGGRYDDMVGGFLGGKREVPAVGVSFGLVPIVEALKQSKDKAVKTPASVLVIPLIESAKALKIAQELRKAGIATDFALGKKGLSKNLQYANALGIPFAVIIGEKEAKQKKLLLRDLNSGEEKLITSKEAVKILKKEK